MRLTTTAALLTASLFLFSCNDEAPAPEVPAGGQTDTSTGKLPPGHPPLEPGSDTAPTAAASAIKWDLPASWTSATPSSSMRMAQAVIPGTAGNGEMVVFFFGPGGGGGVEQNLQRWAEQIEGPGEAIRESFESGGYKISTIEKGGTLQPSMMGSGPATAQPGSRLLAAVVEGEGGPWFFKATGPDATMTKAREPFIKMLRSIRPAGGSST